MAGMYDSNFERNARGSTYNLLRNGVFNMTSYSIISYEQHDNTYIIIIIASQWRDIRGIYLASQGRRHCAPQLRAGKSIIFSVLPFGVGAINGPAAAAALSHGDGGGDRHTTTDGHPANMILLSSL